MVLLLMIALRQAQCDIYNHNWQY